MWNREDMVWTAAYYEGEGCLHYSGHNKWFVQIGSTDLDVLEMVLARVGMGKIYGPFPYKDPKRQHHKPQYSWRLTGVPRVYALCAAMYQFLGKRRKARIEQFFEHFKKWTPPKAERNAKGQFVRWL